ncbi:MAG: carboxymuconolactone decarboxylase family protein [Pseudomonadota bacterium]
MSRIKLADPSGVELAGVMAGGVARYGRPLNAWLAIGHRPSVLERYFGFLFSTFETGPLAQDLKLLAALRSVVVTGCHYTASHRWTAAMGAEINADRAVAVATSDLNACTPTDRLVTELVNAELADDDGRTAELVKQAASELGDAAASELVFTIGLWSGLARANRALDLELDMDRAPASVHDAVDARRS